MGKKTSLPYFFKRNPIWMEIRKNNQKTTYTQYKRNTDHFIDFLKKEHINSYEKLERFGFIDAIDLWSDSLKARNLSPNTIHSYLAGPCRLLQVNMKLVEKPRRMALSITKSRKKSARTQRETLDPKNARLVNFQKKVGIRREEIGDLIKTDLVLDENGYLCVHVRNGKGGKEQYQRILDKDLDFVKNYFEKLENSNEHLFSEKEMNNKVDLHSLRAEHARECYNYYLAMSDEEKEQLIKEMNDRYVMLHRPKEGESLAAYNKRYAKFCKDCRGLYIVRGDNRERATKLGRPLIYDKTALMAVSVFHLSHWRNDVTVKHYML